MAKLCLPLGAAVLWLALAGCDRGSTAANAEKRSLEQSALPVTVTPVRTQKVQRTVELVGTLYANEEVTVAAQVEGRVAAIAADLGDRVERRDVVGRIQDADFRFAVEQLEASLRGTLSRLGVDRLPPPEFDVTRTSLVAKAQAELGEAHTFLNRIRTLYEEKVVSAQEFDSAETRYKTALAEYRRSIEEAQALVADAHGKEAQLGAARKRLTDTVVTAPLPGSISKRHVAAGEYVKAGSAMFTIVQDQPLKLRGLVPERFAPQIRVGQPVELRVDPFPERVFTGKLVRVSPAAEIVSRSFTVEALVDNADRSLKPGFFAKAAVLTRVDDGALTVPQQALVQFAGLSKVFVVQDDVARERVVEQGVRVGRNEIEIVKGLRPGELVAISGLTRLTDGAPVEVSGPNLPLRSEK